MLLPFVNHWNAYCPLLSKGVAVGGGAGKRIFKGGLMKIYALMVLMSAIVAVSYMDMGRWSKKA
ncbi:MAG: hypothetical protein IT537_18530 [Hyphomicrobiales bacterium]|nr:hypothetical protein [Hyphomicrobiales bacterium]